MALAYIIILWDQFLEMATFPLKIDFFVFSQKHLNILYFHQTSHVPEYYQSINQNQYMIACYFRYFSQMANKQFYEFRINLLELFLYQQYSSIRL